MNAGLQNVRTYLERVTCWLAIVDWRDVFEKMKWVLLLPFRIIGALWRFGGAAGRFIVTGAIEFCIVVMGLSFVAFLSFGLIRTIFHPLFR